MPDHRKDVMCFSLVEHFKTL